MCPEPQLLSVYTDGELPSPWKEKLEAHLEECSECREKLKKFLYMQELFKETSQKQIYAEKTEAGGHEKPVLSERELMEEAKEKIWQKLESRRNFRRIGQVNRYNMWKRKITLPIPAAAAAAVVIALLTIIWLRGNPSSKNNGYTQQIASQTGAGYQLAAQEEIPEVIPSSDLNSVLQYLGVDRSEVIILQLPENRNFSRSGDPIIMSADYTGRQQ